MSQTTHIATVMPDLGNRDLSLAARTSGIRAAAVAFDGVTLNSMTMVRYADSPTIREDASATVHAVQEMITAVQGGDLRQPEAMLMAQALALDTIFAGLSQRAARAVPNDIERAERLLRLALKAQAQSRAAIETLITAKNPPVVIARQANIAAGHQQVNNGKDRPLRSASASRRARRAGDLQPAPNELMGAMTNVERMDAGASLEAGGCDQGVAALEERDRAAYGGGQGAQLAKRRSR
jgi:hypothetical protein